MDDEDQGKSLGAYENMERSDIRPDFYGEDDKKSEKSSAAKDTLKAGESAATKKVAEAGLNAVTGGAAGTALKAADQAKSAEKITSTVGSKGQDSSKGDKSSGKAMVKKAAPIVVIALLLIVLYGAVSFIGQWLFPFGFKAREVEDWNSTKVSTVSRTDALTNGTQMGNSGSSKAYSGVIFEDMGFTEEQVQSLNEAGIDFEAGGGDSALIFHLPDGSQVEVVPDASVGVQNGEAVAGSDSVVTDSGSSFDAESLEARKQEILDNLGIAANTSSVMGFTEAMKNWDVKEMYMRATRSWRGDISGWFSEMTETVMSRLGISRNNYKNFELSGDNDADEEAFVELATSLPAATEESSIADESFEERVEKVATDSREENCGAISAANDIEGVITADQTARQVSAGSLWMEAIDKTIAGEGSTAPLSASTNIIVRSGGADTEGIHHLFGSGELNQGDNNLLLSSAQANIGKNGSANLGAADEKIYRQCMYEGNTNNGNGGLLGGAIVKINSMFKKVINWAKGMINLIKGLSGAGANTALAVLNPTIAKYEQMKTQTFFSGDKDTAIIGEAMVNSAERIMGEKAKTSGQTTGDNTSVLAFYREQQEVIAEQAEYDRRTKSPFDITNEHTFLGSLAYSLIPIATSTQSLSVTSTMSSIGNLLSSAVTNLLPTSSAVSETDFTFSRGDCVLANSLLAVSDGYCNQYYVSDLSLSGMKPVEVFDEVAYLREDVMGYVYGKIREREKAPDKKNKESKSDPDYGEGPLNDAENSAGHHWPHSKVISKIQDSEGTANGCETDWEFTYIRNPLIYGTDYDNRHYYLDEPVEWSYTRSTNFEYLGYATGWHNRGDASSPNSASIENAVNDEAPGECTLDMSVQEVDKQPVINQNGALMAFLILSGQRGSDWGSTDDNNLQYLARVDFTKGRLHPDVVGANNKSVLYPEKDSAKSGSGSIYEELEWSGGNDIASSKFMSRWIGGTAYTMRTEASAQDALYDIYNVYNGDNQVFTDPTMDNHYFWEEMKYYQAYSEILEWMEAIGKIRSTSTSLAVNKYYDEHPLDNSYEGIIARYSGMSRDHVVAVLDLINYMEFLAKYDPSDLYPTPVDTPEEIHYEQTEVVAEADPGIRPENVVYDEVRNRTVVV